MPITLAQAQNLSQEKLVKTVIDEFRKSALLDMLTFDNTVKPGGGNSLAYTYNRVTTLPTAASRALNTEYTPQEPATTPVTVLLKIFGVTAFCGGNLLASLLMNLSAGTERTRWPAMLAIGAAQILLYFFLFSYLIRRFDLRTPGREKDRAGTAGNKFRGLEEAALVVEGLGGKDNINTLDCCYTRLRVSVRDAALIRETLINRTGNSGIVKKGNEIQIVYGLQVPEVRKCVEMYLQQAENNTTV
jgi:glucose-like phosphotransferase system IIB component